MIVETGKVLGRLTDGWWAQVYDHAADPRGRLIAGISLESASAGREALVRLHELYFGNLEGDPLVALKRAGMVIAKEFPGIELASLAIVNGAIYTAAVGAVGIWTRLEDQEGWIINFSRVGRDVLGLSGWAKPGQILVAGNSKFWQVLSLGAVRAAVANGVGASDMAESLAAVVAGNDIGVGGVGVVVNFVSKLRDILPKPVGPIYVSHGDKTVSRRRNMWLGVGFLVFLFLLVGGWQWAQSDEQIKQSEQNKRIEQLVHKFNEAQTLVQLNPVRSRQLLTEVETLLQDFKNTKKKDERIRQIETDFGQVLGVASGVKQATTDEILDLDWLRSGMIGSRLGLVEGKLVILDTEGDRLVVVDPAKKSGEIVTGKTDLGETKLMAGYPGKITILSKKGIIECSTLNTQCSIVIKPDEGWGEIKDMKMFAGNIYLLTPNNILRYQVIDGGYGGKQKWLSDADSSLSKSQSMSIDSFIWVGTTDGQILKFARGAKENFAVTDLDKPFGKKTVVYTDSDTEKLYVLDPSNGRVVVLEKTGAYKFQYQFDQAKEATDFVVDEKGGQMYLLVGSKIIGVKL